MHAVVAVSAPSRPGATRASRELDAEDIVPSWFEKLLYNRPCCAWFAILGLTLLLCVVAGMMFSTGLLVVTTNSVWDVLGDLEVKRWDAYSEAKDDGGDAKIKGDEEIPERSQAGSTIVIAYEVKGGSIFDPEIMDKIMQMEMTVVGAPRWNEYCQLIYDTTARCTGGDTVVSHYRPGVDIQIDDMISGFGPCGGDAGLAQQCHDEAFPGLVVGDRPCVSRVYNPGAATTLPDVDTNYTDTLRCMCCADAEGGCDDLECENTETSFCGSTIREHRKDFRNRLIGKNFSCKDGSANLLRSYYNLGYPRAGYKNTDDEDEMKEMREEVEKWSTGTLYTSLMEKRDELIDSNLEIYIFGAGMESTYFMTTLSGDQLLAVGSLAVVFLWIWIGTSSFFLAACGMMEIMLSIPLAMFVWGVFQGKFVSFFMLTIVFLVLGIGADDIFVLWDAVQQSQGLFLDEDDAGIKQFAWALRRARNAMTVTSSTTFCALILAGTSSIPSLSAFGMFGALVIFFDFLLVVTFFPAAIVVYNNRYRDCKGPCLFVHKGCSKCFCGPDAWDAPKETLRAPERFFRDTWSASMNRFRVPIIFCWAAVGIAAIAVSAAALRPAKEAPQFFADDYGQRYIALIGGQDFPQSKESYKVPVYIVMGVDPEKPIDRSGTNYQDPDNIGEPAYKELTTLLTPEGQMSLWELCETARSGDFDRVSQDEGCSGELVNTSWGGAQVRIESGACQTGAVCFIDWVRDFRLSVRGSTEDDWHEDEDLETTLTSAAFSPNGVGHPAPSDFECGDCCNSFGWYVCMISRVRQSAGMQRFNAWHDMSKFFVEDGKLKWAYVGINSTLPPEALPLNEIQPHFNDWTDFADENLGSIEGYQTCGLWPWMIVQREIIKSVFQSIAYCLIMAFVILTLSTTNWMISVISFLCILLIVLTFAMLITIAGKELGIFEAIGLIVVVGLSVDYSVHIGHSYNETRYIDGQEASRSEKVRHALTEMGISVISGGATTFLASIFLLPASFMFYHVFGVFMLITVIVSILVALTLLPALLCVMGPQGTRGDLQWLRRACCWLSAKLCSCGQRKNLPKAAEEEGAHRM